MRDVHIHGDGGFHAGRLKVNERERSVLREHFRRLLGQIVRDVAELPAEVAHPGGLLGCSEERRSGSREYADGDGQVNYFSLGLARRNI